MTTKRTIGMQSSARRLRLGLGVLLWLGLLVAGYWSLLGNGPVATTTERVVAHLRDEPPRFQAEFPKGSPLAIGNPLRIRVANGFFAAGRIESVVETEFNYQVEVSIFPEYARQMRADVQLTAARTSGQVSWVVQTLLPDERKDFIERQLKSRWENERHALLDALKPGMKRFSTDSFEVIRRRLPAVLRANDADVQMIVQVLQEKGWEGELLSVFNEVLWPTVEQRSLPILESIGNELVDELPVMSMSWSYLVQSMPFGSKDRLERKLKEFLQEDALPIVEKRGSEFEDMAREVIKETIKDPRTRAASSRALTAIAEDPRLNTALEHILEALLVEDPEVRAFTADIVNREDLRQPIEDFMGRFEPEVKRIANSLLLDREGVGINPDLARVLRRKLLREDEDWVLLEPGVAADTLLPARLPGANGGIR